MDEYYLHADLIVREADAPRFERLANLFIANGAFARLKKTLKYELVLALRTRLPFGFTGYATYEPGPPVNTIKDDRVSHGARPESVFRYVNVWRIPVISDLALADVRNAAAADKAYVQIEGTFVREIQNIACRVQYETDFPGKAVGENILRVTRQFDPAQVGTYVQATVPGVVPALAKNDWNLLGSIQNVTGPLNTVTEFWQTPPRGGDQSAMLAVVNELNQGLLKQSVENFKNLPKLDVSEPLIRSSFDPGQLSIEVTRHE
jgi:hypothetical protein